MRLELRGGFCELLALTGETTSLNVCDDIPPAPVEGVHMVECSPADRESDPTVGAVVARPFHVPEVIGGNPVPKSIRAGLAVVTSGQSDEPSVLRILCHTSPLDIGPTDGTMTVSQTAALSADRNVRHDGDGQGDGGTCPPPGGRTHHRTLDPDPEDPTRRAGFRGEVP